MQDSVIAQAISANDAAVHQHQPVGLQSQRQVVQHADHGVSRKRLALQQAHQRHLVRWVEVGGGLVEQQQRGIDRQRPRQQHALALAARQFMQAPMLPGRAFGVRHGLLHQRFVARRRRGEQAQVRQPAQVHHLAHRQIAAGLALLGQPRHPARLLTQRHLVQWPAAEPHAASVGLLQTRQHAQQGRLARTVGADDGGPTGLQGQRHPIQSLRAAEPHADRLRFEQRTHARARRCNNHSK